MRTFVAFVAPVCTQYRRIEVFESFHEARAFAEQHPDLVELEFEAITSDEARNIARMDWFEQALTYTTFINPWSDEKAIPAGAAGF